MADEQPIRIPIHSRDGIVVAYALIDAVDGAVAESRWALTAKGYVHRRDRGVMVYLHRLLLGLTKGDGLEGDHVDRDKLNNRRSNLRIVPKGRNQQNTQSRQGSTSLYRGVSWNAREGKWVAQARTGGRNFFLGLFDSEAEAAEAARACRLAHMPFSVEP